VHPATFEPRSILFVPADADAFIEKAGLRGADVIVLDLEDGVAPSAKEAARAALGHAAAHLRAADACVFVRLNNVPGLLARDLKAAVSCGADGVVIPKVETAAQLVQLDADLAGEESVSGRKPGTLRVLALIETPLGVSNAFDIAKASPRLAAMCFGSEDFAAAMGVDPSPGSLSWPAQAVAIAASAAGVLPLGLPGSVGNFTDLAAYRQVVDHAKVLGLRGATCIHPAQVPVLNEVFGGTREEADEAQRLLAAFDAAVAAGKGAIALDGRMIDEPIANRARRLLERYRRFNPVSS